MNNKPKVQPIASVFAFLKITIWWIWHIINRGLKSDICFEDFYDATTTSQSEQYTRRMLMKWHDELSLNSPSLFRAIVCAFGRPFVGWTIIYCCLDLFFSLVQTLCLANLVVYFEGGSSKHDAITLSVGIMLSLTLSLLICPPIKLWLQQHSLNIRSACSGIIFRTTMDLPKSSIPNNLNVQIEHLLLSDLTYVGEAIYNSIALWKGPINSVVFTYFVYHEIGLSTIIGLFVFFAALLPVQAILVQVSATVRRQTSNRTVARLHLTNEFIQCIHSIRINGWDYLFTNKIQAIRDTELKDIRTHGLIKAVQHSLSLISQMFLFVCLVSYVYMGHVISMRSLVLMLLFVYRLHESMVLDFTQALISLSEGCVALKRVQDYLILTSENVSNNTRPHKAHTIRRSISQSSLVFESNEADTRTEHANIISDDICYQTGIHLMDVTAKWDNNRAFAIKHLSLSVGAGELCVVCGQTGSGKSTLLNVILGELGIYSGVRSVNGTISYACQEPWLFDGTVRNNIVFGDIYDPVRYAEVTKVCALQLDLSKLSFGDQTMVGENGIRLSAGLRARVHLARAVYKKADIYLLDNPFAFVSEHVEQRLMADCLDRFLENTIRVLVTHQAQYSYNCIVVDMSEGQCSVQRNELQFPRPVEDELNLDQVSVGKTDDIHNFAEQSESTESKSMHGNPLFGKYFLSSNKICVWIVFSLAQLVLFGHQGVLTVWCYWEMKQSNSTTSYVKMFDSFSIELSTAEFENARWKFVLWTMLLMMVAFIFVVARNCVFMTECVHQSRRLHKLLINGINRTTIRFYNNTHSTVIRSRFSTDLHNIDLILPDVILKYLTTLFQIIPVFLIVINTNPLVVFSTISIAVLFHIIRCGYSHIARSSQRFESNMLSKLCAHLHKSCHGLPTIRAFKACAILQNEFHQEVDTNVGARYLKIVSHRAFYYWLNVISIIYIGLILLTIFVTDIKELPEGQVGLAIFQCIWLVKFCQSCLNEKTQLDWQMTSLKRIMEYVNLSKEDQTLSKYYGSDWPQTGAIKITNLCFRHSDQEPLVLRNISLQVNGKEQIGIVGSTGAGKTSLGLAFVRMGKLDGVIKINGVDITHVSLKQLRRKISVIPQLPTLFHGSLRFNLDPMSLCADDRLRTVLEQVSLKSFAMGNGLNTDISDGGSNLSAGQRQLICIARAILQNNKLIILDDAFRELDRQTDQIIHQTMYEQCTNRTVLMISSRLKHLIHMDKLVILDNGQVVEFGRPHALLRDNESRFKHMFEQSKLDVHINVRRTVKERSTLSPSLEFELDGELDRLFP